MTEPTQHPTELQLSMHADHALADDEAAGIEAHLQSCAVCRAELLAIRDEARFIIGLMQAEDSADAAQVVIPAYTHPATLRGFALANLATALVIWLAQFLWKTLFGELVVNATTWATSIYLPDIYAMASGFALYLLEEGTAMLDAYLGFIVVSVLAGTTLWLLYMYRKFRADLSMCLIVLVIGTMGLPTPVNALDFRRDASVVTIPASETIDDTLLVAADTILIQGTVTGDVIAVGRSIDISGSVGGNLVTFAESVKVRGTVGGLALGAASTYELDAAVAGDLWAAGSQVDLERGARVGRNATVAAQNTTVAGYVNKDLYAFGETVVLSGQLGEDLEVFAARLRLMGDAHILGNVRLRSDSEDSLYRAEGVRVDGDVEFLDLPDEFDRQNPYTTLEFYLWQIARLISAFLVGLVLLWLVPGLGAVSIPGGIEGLKTAGMGLVTLVSVPIIALLVAITLVGLPFTVIGLFVWALGIYLAKIVVAAIVGRMLLSNSERHALVLFAGIATVIVAVNVPFIGGIVNFVLTIVGLGLLAQHVVDRMQAKQA